MSHRYSILPKEAYGRWLDPECQDKNELLSLLRPFAGDDLIAEPVSTPVNSPKNDVAQCVVPVAVWASRSTPLDRSRPSRWPVLR